MSSSLSLFDLVMQGGFVVKSVLLLLVLCSIASWAIIMNRLKAFKKFKSEDDLFKKIYLGSTGLKEIADRTSHLTNSPARKVFIHGHEELSRLKKMIKEGHIEGRELISSFRLSTLDRALSKGILETDEQASRYLTALASIGPLAPFIGLLGTVWGIIDSFQGLASGGGGIELVAPGIAEALIATAVGLFAAIPAYWFSNLFIGRKKEMKARSTGLAQDFMNLVERSLMSKNT